MRLHNADKSAGQHVVSRRGFIRAALIGATLSLMGCASGSGSTADTHASSTPSTSAAPPSAPADAPASPEAPASPATPFEGTNPMSIQVIIGGSAFVATLDEGEAGQELARRLPLSLTMEELHGNEKYCYTGQDFGGAASVPAAIHAGELMAFGGDCLVLFYEEISSNSWSYARVGRIDDPSGLAEACGSGAASVEFKAL